METCIMTNCFKSPFVRGMCKTHYFRDYRENGPQKTHTQSREERASKTAEKINHISYDHCLVSGCDRHNRGALCDRHSRMQRIYGIGVEKMAELEAVTHCQICGAPRDSAFAIDHDHETQKVRGVLCTQCNLALHKAEQPGWLDAAAWYLGYGDTHP